MTHPAAPAKILYLVSEDWYFISHRIDLAAAAKARGYDVVVATRVVNGGCEIEARGLRVIPIEFERSRIGIVSELRTLFALIRLYRRERPDLTHHVAVKPVIYGAIAARLSGVEGVVNALMGLGFVFSSRSLKARLLKWPVSLALRLALGSRRQRTIVQNPDDAASLAGSGLVAAAAIRLVPGSGVDVARFSSEAPPQGPPLVVLSARLLRAKGVLAFAEAAMRLKAKGHVARFALVGAPDAVNPDAVTEAELAPFIASGAIEAWGFRSDMPEILRQASLVCLPSTYGEGIPKALIEAAAAQRAIVTTDTPGCREIVRHQVNGWLVPPHDIDALTATLDEALSDPGRLADFGRKGREIVVASYTLQTVIEKTLAIYAELLGREPT